MSSDGMTLEKMVGRLARMEVFQTIQFAVAETLVATASVREAAPRILRTIGINFGWHIGMFWAKSPNEKCLTMQASWQSPVVDGASFLNKSKELKFCEGESLPGRVFASGTPVWLEDFPSQGYLRSEIALASGIKSALAFPIFSDLECIGVMEFFTKADKGHQDIDVETLDTLVNVGYRIGQFFKRRQLERDNKEAESRYRVLVDSALSAVIVANSSGIIVEWNAAAEHLFGWTRDEMLGKNLITIMPESFRERHLAGMERIKKNDHTMGSRVIGKLVDLVGLRKDGSEFPMTLSLSTWNTTGNRFFGAILIEHEKESVEK